MAPRIHHEDPAGRRQCLGGQAAPAEWPSGVPLLSGGWQPASGLAAHDVSFQPIAEQPGRTSRHRPADRARHHAAGGGLRTPAWPRAGRGCGTSTPPRPGTPTFHGRRPGPPQRGTPMIPDSPGTPAPAAESGPVCYLIHFDRRYQHAGHYLGFTEDLDARLHEHRSGRGARLMEVITDAGIGWHVTRTWPGGRDRERALKDLHAGPKLCPDCTPAPLPVKTGRAAQPLPGPRRLTPESMTTTTRPPADYYAHGEQLGRNFLRGRDTETASQLAAAFAYITGPYRAAGQHTAGQAEMHRGFQETITRELERRGADERSAALEEPGAELEAAG